MELLRRRLRGSSDISKGWSRYISHLTRTEILPILRSGTTLRRLFVFMSQMGGRRRIILRLYSTIAGVGSLGRTMIIRKMPHFPTLRKERCVQSWRTGVLERILD